MDATHKLGYEATRVNESSYKLRNTQLNPLVSRSMNLLTIDNSRELFQPLIKHDIPIKYLNQDKEYFSFPYFTIPPESSPHLTLFSVGKNNPSIDSLVGITL